MSARTFFAAAARTVLTAGVVFVGAACCEKVGGGVGKSLYPPPAAPTVLTAGLAFAAFGPTAAPAQNSPDVQSILNAIGGQPPTTPSSSQVPPTSNPSQTTIAPTMAQT